MTKFVASIVLAGLAFVSVGQTALAQVQEGEFYRIKCVNGKKVLSVEDKGKGESDQIVQTVSGPKEVQQWKFVKIGNYYKIVNRKTGKALNVSNNSLEEGAPVIQWDASVDAENQQWSLEKKGNAYVIRARHSGQVLDVGAGSKERKAALIQYPLQADNNENQLFEILPVANKE